MLNYAGYFKRFIAGLIDYFIIWAFQKTIGILIAPRFLQKGLATLPTEALTQSYYEMINAWIGLAYQLIIGIIPLVLFAYLISNKGYSPGKKLLGLAIQKKNGGNLSFGKAIVRELGKIISIIPLGLGFIWIFFDKKRQAWHDKFAGSVVVSSK